jgi:predicted ribosomally synthesized peptide with nif11-like leader
LAFHQQAAEQFSSHLLRGVREEKLGEAGRSWWLWEWLLLAGSYAILLTLDRTLAMMVVTTSRSLTTMSEEQLKAFLEAVKADAGLQEKLKAAADADGVVATAKAAGYVISVEELKSTQAEVSDEELEGVVGGLLKLENPFPDQ